MRDATIAMTGPSLEGGALRAQTDRASPHRGDRRHDDLRGRGSAPANIQVLVGQAGVSLVNVMTASTNTGISTTPGQCVFHVTVRPGVGGVAEKITDIVIVNAGAAPLTGINTATASATVQ